MKKTRITCLTLATVMLASSCSSSYQASGGVTGAMIGGEVGRAVGFLSGHGHFRGENAALGSLIGMGVGALLGVGIASQIEEKEKAEARRGYEDYGNGGVENHRNSGDYQTRGGADAVSSAHTSISISDLSYMDADGDGYLSKDETLEVEGFITNTSDDVLYDVVIYITTNAPKFVSLSPSLTTNLQPGQKIRYTGRVHCNKVHKGQGITLNLNTDYAGRTNTSECLIVRMK